MKNYPPHPLSELFPLHDGPSMWELRDDLKANGQLEEIVLFDGKVLDGRRRQACLIGNGQEPRYRQFEGDEKEALTFVVSKNLKRRHLSDADRAFVASKIANLKHGSNQFKGKTVEGEDSAAALSSQNGLVSEEKAAEMLNVSTASVKRAKAVNEGTPELQEEVKSGKKSLTAGAKEAIEQTKIYCRNCRIGGPRKGCKDCAAKRKEAKQAATPAPKQDTDAADAMRTVNAEIESFCRDLMKHVEEKLPKDVWLTDLNRREGAIRKFKDGCELLRSCKCAAVCPRCKGTKTDCRPCKGTGRLPKQNLDQLK